jgi:hypothetical protein
MCERGLKLSATEASRFATGSYGATGMLLSRTFSLVLFWCFASQQRLLELQSAGADLTRAL